ncbi:MAG: amidase, partial [Vulcanimicrobiaceae bacterium]
ADGALASARLAEKEIMSSGPRTPLHGIPAGYKDVIDVAGMPTTAGSRLLEGNVPSEDSFVARRLRAAGSIALGKLNTFEFATGGQERYGEARNPWNLMYATGGSSTGPAAALAGRLVPLALGTDTGGSVRIPASFCGLVALRPARGTIDCSGVVPLSPTLDEVGPMARTVDDCALLYEALAGLKMTASDFRSFRIGIPDPLWAACDTDVISCMDAALKVLRELGASIHKVQFETARYGVAASWVISYHEMFQAHRERLIARPSDYTPMFYNKIVAAGDLTDAEVETAKTIAQKITGEFNAAMCSVDAILLPATPSPAYPLGNQQMQLDNGTFTRPVSLAGLPALAVPWGFTNAGLPLGMQLVSRAGDEARLFHIARRYEAATPWHLAAPNFSCPAITAPINPVRAALEKYRAEVTETAI